MITNGHVQDDSLEAFAMGRLQAEETEQIEDHLLICEVCRRRLAETDEFLKATRIAARRIREEQPVPAAAERPTWMATIRAFMYRPQFALACAAALAALLVTPVLLRQAPYAEANLTAMRGVEQGPVLASGSRLRLRLDLRGVEPLPQYRVIVVTADGKAVADTLAAPAADTPGTLSMQVDRRFSEGQYWVRLRTPDTPGRLLREYPLRVAAK